MRLQKQIIAKTPCLLQQGVEKSVVNLYFRFSKPFIYAVLGECYYSHSFDRSVNTVILGVFSTVLCPFDS